jgi:hypothetical protein
VSLAKDSVALLGLEAYRHPMKLQEIEQEALGLSEPERAKLISSLIVTLGPPETEVSDEAVQQRDADLERGAVQPVLHEEFVRQVHDERGR